MNIIEEYELFELKKLIDNIINVVECNEDNSIPEFYNIIKRMSRNIDMCIQSGDEYIYELMDIVKSDWENANMPNINISKYHIWQDDYDKRIMINNEFKNIIEDINDIIYG